MKCGVEWEGLEVSPHTQREHVTCLVCACSMTHTNTAVQEVGRLTVVIVRRRASKSVEPLDFSFYVTCSG